MAHQRSNCFRADKVIIINLYMVFFLLNTSSHSLVSQENAPIRFVTLQEFVDMAGANAIQIENSRKQFDIQLAELKKEELASKPSLVLNSTLPNFLRAVEAITFPDGSDVFLNRSLMNSSVGVSLEKRLLNTGGTISIGTSLERLDIFKTQAVNASTSYFFDAVQLGFTQPLLQFNELKWNVKIAQARVTEEMRKLDEARAEVELKAATFFLQLYEQIARMENTNRDIFIFQNLLNTSKAKLAIAGISRMDYLQLEIDLESLRMDSVRISGEIEKTRELMHNFLDLPQTYSWMPKWDGEPIPTFSIDIEEALQKALQNSSLLAVSGTNQLLAQRDLDKSKKDNGPTMEFNINFGLNRVGQEFGDLFNNYLDQERVRFTLNYPIFDWGKADAHEDLARQKLAFEKSFLEEKMNQLRSDLLEQIFNLNNKQGECRRLLKLIDLFEEKCDAAVQQFEIGQIDALTLSLSFSDLNRTRNEYLLGVKQAWQTYFEIQKLTLYDFR